MELKGSKTEANLMTAFAGESQARNKYTYFASKARKDGYVQIANISRKLPTTKRSTRKFGLSCWSLMENASRDSLYKNLTTSATCTRVMRRGLR